MEYGVVDPGSAEEWGYIRVRVPAAKVVGNRFNLGVKHDETNGPINGSLGRRLGTRRSIVNGAPLDLPRAIWPNNWHHKGLRDPMIKIIRALYGLRRSGLDWASHSTNGLHSK